MAQTERGHYGQFRRATEERPLTAARQAGWDRGVARLSERERALHGPAHDADAVAAQRLFLVRSGLMPAREAFAPRPYRPSR